MSELIIGVRFTPVVEKSADGQFVTAVIITFPNIGFKDPAGALSAALETIERIRVHFNQQSGEVLQREAQAAGGAKH